MLTFFRSAVKLAKPTRLAPLARHIEPIAPMSARLTALEQQLRQFHVTPAASEAPHKKIFPPHPVARVKHARIKPSEKSSFFEDNAFSSKDIANIVDDIRQNPTTTEHLTFSGTHIDDNPDNPPMCTYSISTLLLNNPTLRTLQVKGTFGKRGITHFAGALSSNNALASLILEGNVTDDDLAPLLEVLETKNDTLQHLIVKNSGGKIIHGKNANAIEQQLKYNYNHQQAALVSTPAPAFMVPGRIYTLPVTESTNPKVIEATLQSLQQETLAISGLTPSLVEAMSTMPISPKVECLDVGGNHLNDTSASHIAIFVKKNPTVKDLALGHNGIRSAGIAEIAHLPLARLDLSNNGVDAVGASHLGTMLETWTCFKELYLRNNPIGDNGLTWLANGLKSSSLEIFDVRGCGITNEGANLLINTLPNTRLKHLYFDGNNISPENMKTINELLEENVRKSLRNSLKPR